MQRRQRSGSPLHDRRSLQHHARGVHNHVVEFRQEQDGQGREVEFRRRVGGRRDGGVLDWILGGGGDGSGEGQVEELAVGACYSGGEGCGAGGGVDGGIEAEGGHFSFFSPSFLFWGRSLARKV